MFPYCTLVNNPRLRKAIVGETICTVMGGKKDIFGEQRVETAVGSSPSLSTVCSTQLINLMKSPFYRAEGAAKHALSAEMASRRNLCMKNRLFTR